MSADAPKNPGTIPNLTSDFDFANFTDRSRRVVNLAVKEAIRFRRTLVSGEHILCALAVECSGIAATALAQSQVTPEKIRDAIKARDGEEGDTYERRRDVTACSMSVAAMDVFRQAVQAATALEHPYVGTEHLLFGVIMCVKSSGFEILESIADPAVVWLSILDYLGIPAAQLPMPLTSKEISQGTRQQALKAALDRHQISDADFQAILRAHPTIVEDCGITDVPGPAAEFTPQVDGFHRLIQAVREIATKRADSDGGWVEDPELVKTAYAPATPEVASGKTKLTEVLKPHHDAVVAGAAHEAALVAAEPASLPALDLREAAYHGKISAVEGWLRDYAKATNNGQSIAAYRILKETGGAGWCGPDMQVLFPTLQPTDAQLEFATHYAARIVIEYLSSRMGTTMRMLCKVLEEHYLSTELSPMMIGVYPAKKILDSAEQCVEANTSDAPIDQGPGVGPRAWALRQALGDLLAAGVLVDTLQDAVERAFPDLVKGSFTWTQVSKMVALTGFVAEPQVSDNPAVEDVTDAADPARLKRVIDAAGELSAPPSQPAPVFVDSSAFPRNGALDAILVTQGKTIAWLVTTVVDDLRKNTTSLGDPALVLQWLRTTASHISKIDYAEQVHVWSKIFEDPVEYMRKDPSGLLYARLEMVPNKPTAIDGHLVDEDLPDVLQAVMADKGVTLRMLESALNAVPLGITEFRQFSESLSMARVEELPAGKQFQWWLEFLASPFAQMRSAVQPVSPPGITMLGTLEGPPGAARGSAEKAPSELDKMFKDVEFGRVDAAVAQWYSALPEGLITAMEATGDSKQRLMSVFVGSEFGGKETLEYVQRVDKSIKDVKCSFAMSRALWRRFLRDPLGEMRSAVESMVPEAPLKGTKARELSGHRGVSGYTATALNRGLRAFALEFDTHTRTCAMLVPAEDVRGFSIWKDPKAGRERHFVLDDGNILSIHSAGFAWVGPLVSDKGLSKFYRCQEITFHEGNPDKGLNGVSIEALIAVILDRLDQFQRGKFRCIENAMAMKEITGGLLWLAERTGKREVAGIEGTQTP